MSQLCRGQLRISHGSSLRHQVATYWSWYRRRCWSVTAYSSGKTLLILQLTSISRGRSTIRHLWTRMVAVAILYRSVEIIKLAFHGHRHRHGHPRRHPREDRRENVDVSLSFHRNNFRKSRTSDVSARILARRTSASVSLSAS